MPCAALIRNCRSRGTDEGVAWCLCVVVAGGAQPALDGEIAFTWPVRHPGLKLNIPP